MSTKITTRMGCALIEIKSYNPLTETVTALREDGVIREYHVSDLRHEDGIKGIFAELEHAGLA
jgi:hypothetical protein